MCERMRVEILARELMFQRCYGVISNVKESVDENWKTMVPTAEIIIGTLDNHKPNDYAYENIAEFEEIVGYEVHDAFKGGWDMARLTNKMVGVNDEMD